MMKVADNIYLIQGKNKGSFPYCNVLIVDNLVIDAGAGIDIIEKIVTRVDKLILSHTHPDHCSGAWLFNKMGKKVLSPEGFATDLDSLATRFVSKELKEYWKNLMTSTINIKSFASEKYLDEDILNKQPEIVAISVPGHTMDHHVFLIEGKILYGADVDLTSFGPWYGHVESDPQLFKESIEKLLNLDVEIFISAHEKPVYGRENIVNRINRYLDVFDERDRKLINILKEPKSIDELVEISPFYGKKPFAKPMLDYFEKMMIEKHLENLMKRGELIRIGEKFIVK